MLTKAPHVFDDATRIIAGDSSWQGNAGEDYFAFVGQFGGATAASILRALIQHPERSGDPLALTEARRRRNQVLGAVEDQQHPLAAQMGDEFGGRVLRLNRES